MNQEDHNLDLTHEVEPRRSRDQEGNNNLEMIF